MRLDGEVQKWKRYNFVQIVFKDAFGSNGVKSLTVCRVQNIIMVSSFLFIALHQHAPKQMAPLLAINLQDHHDSP